MLPSRGQLLALVQDFALSFRLVGRSQNIPPGPTAWKTENNTFQAFYILLLERIKNQGGSSYQMAARISNIGILPIILNIYNSTYSTSTGKYVGAFLLLVLKFCILFIQVCCFYNQIFNA